MQKKVSVVTTVFLCITVCLFSILGTIIFTSGNYTSNLEKYSAALKMYEILEFYKSSYVGELDEELAETYALKYLVVGTGDKYGYYYTPEELAALLSSQTGNLVGIGIMINAESDMAEGLEIAHVIPSSPAEQSGLMAKDIIIKVDGKQAKDYSYEEFSSMIAGEVGTAVTITVKRGDSVLDFNIVRASIQLETVVYDFDPDTKTGIVRILEFIENTPQQFTNALRDLQEKGAEKFIFDLRDNPGGLLDSVVTMLENLLPKDSVITTQVRKNGAEKVYKTKVGYDFNYPCAVLINGNSASAAELFTAALRDHGVATIVGENSYGKGVGQGVYPLSDGSALKITDFYYNPPCGVNFDGVGIAPDHEVALGDGESIDYYRIDTDDRVIKAAIDMLG